MVRGRAKGPKEAVQNVGRNVIPTTMRFRILHSLRLPEAAVMVESTFWTAWDLVADALFSLRRRGLDGPSKFLKRNSLLVAQGFKVLVDGLWFS